MPISLDEWASIRALAERVVAQNGGGQQIMTAKVAKVDPDRRVVYVPELGDQPIPLIDFNGDTRSYDADVPVGAIVIHGDDIIPENYLKADGRAVSRTLYPELFAAIGTDFGVGDGSTTFNLPPATAAGGGGIEIYGETTQGIVLAVNATTGLWTQVPVPAPTKFVSTKSDGVNDDFTRNADGSVTINKAGNYNIAATVSAAEQWPDTSNFNWGLAKKNGALPTTADWLVTNNITIGGTTNSYPGTTISGTWVCAAGDRIAIWLWHSSGATRGINLHNFSIARLGSGPTGPQGIPGQLEVYEQATDPGSKPVGAVWIDTDEQPAPWTSSIPLLSSLPSSPYDGEEIYFQNTAMAAVGTVWHLKYRTGATGSYKWEFLGGAPLVGGPAPAFAAFLSSSTTFVDITGAPTLTLPLAGDYEIMYHAHIQNAGSWTTATDIHLALIVAGTNIAELVHTVTGPYSGSQPAGRARAINLAAGALVKAQGKCDAALSTRYDGVGLTAIPARVG